MKSSYMRTFYPIIFLSFILILGSCSTKEQKQTEQKIEVSQYNYEIATENCINEYFSKNVIKWGELQSDMNEILQEITIVGNKSKNENVMYRAFIEYIIKHNKMPVSNKVRKLKKRLLNSMVIITKNGFGYPIAYCMKKSIKKYKSDIDKNKDKQFSDLMKAINAVNSARAMSPALLAAGMKRIFTTENMNKSFYKKAYFLAFFVPTLSYSVN